MRKTRSQTLPARRRSGQTGFSIVEVLVGFLILLMVLMGLLPLFTRAIIQNVSGNEATVVTNMGTTQLENLYQLSFNNQAVGITGGSVRQTIDYWARDEAAPPGTERWESDPTDLFATWERTTEIRQFSIGAVNDNNLDGILDEIAGLEDTDHDGYFDSELPAGTTPNAIHLKEVRVRIRSQRNPFGAGEPTELTLRSLKAF